MKFHIKCKKKRAHFSSTEYRSPPQKFSISKNLSQGKCAAGRCPQKPCVLVLNNSYRKESNQNEHHNHPPMIIQGISWHVIRDSSTDQCT